MRIIMLKTAKGHNGNEIRTYYKGVKYQLSEKLANQFINLKVADFFYPKKNTFLSRDE